MAESDYRERRLDDAMQAAATGFFVACAVAFAVFISAFVSNHHHRLDSHDAALRALLEREVDADPDAAGLRAILESMSNHADSE